MDNRTPYKTAAELGIADWERDGLIALIRPFQTPTIAGMPMTVTPTGYLAKSMRRIRVPSAADLHAGNLSRPAVEMSEAEQAALFVEIECAVEGGSP